MEKIHRLISRIRQRFGLGARRTAVFLNRHGLTTKTGLPWTENRVKAAYQYPRRRAMLVVARTVGTHTDDEWAALLAVYGGACLRCGADGAGKDHIMPLCMANSSDDLDNLQPLCLSCNSYPNKHNSDTDYRIGARHKMTPERIKEIRSLTGENSADFGKRFARSGRTVEDWEQGRRNPDPLAIAALVRIEVSQRKKASRKPGKIPK